MRRICAALIAIGLSAGVLLAGAAPAGAADSGSLLSETGQQAVSDLRGCLASNNRLDVYYLLDASGSLFSYGDQVGSDPTFVRADLIANSLRELGSLQEGLQIDYALGFFGTHFQRGSNWTEVPSSQLNAQADRLAALIRHQGRLDWTNWRDGITAAQQTLAQRSKQTGGCQVLVWLTDGGMNLGTGSQSANDAAINDLCGAQVASTSKPAMGSGPFDEMRQSGVVVFGVLLRDAHATPAPEDTRYSPYMRPLVEGSGGVAGHQVTCGTTPIPATYAAGAFIQARSPADLALVFLRLGATIDGGSPADFAPDGTFPVDRGVGRFTITTTATDWKLTSPSGSTFTAGSHGSLTIQSTGGATSITEVPKSDRDIGKWRWSSSTRSQDSVYLASALMITLDNPGTLVAGQPATVTGQVIRRIGLPANLADYDDEFQVSLAGTGETGAPVTATGTMDASGRFSYRFRALPALGAAKIRAELTSIRTRPSGSRLADVSGVLSVSVTVPDSYPTVTPQPLVLSDLEGSAGSADGRFVIHGAKDGSEGKVCFPSGLTPKVVSDTGDRASKWHWSFSGAARCLAIAGSRTTSVAVSARNAVAANSDVKASLPISLQDANGHRLDGALEISFHSERPINALTFGLTTLLLLLLGILLPLAILYVLNYSTHRISRGGQLARASIPVSIDPAGVLHDRDGVPLAGQQYGTDQFRFERSLPNARRVQDTALGELRARVALWPFGRPWFEISPPSGRIVLGPAAFLPRTRQRAAERGRLAGFNGDLGAAWGVVIDESALRAGEAGDSVAGTLVVYLRNKENGAAAFQNRMAEVLNPPALKPRVDRARALLVADTSASKTPPAPRDNRPGPARMPHDPSDPPRRPAMPAGENEPPRRPVSGGVSAPPPRSGSSSTPKPPRHGGGPSSLPEPPRRS